ADQTMQDVIGVCRDNQLFDRQAHLFGQITGVNVAKVTRGHRERYRTMRAAEREGSAKVVNTLGHDARPIDGIVRNELAIGWQKTLCAETSLHLRLAIVKIAFDRDVVNFFAEYRRHLTTLYVGDATIRMQNKYIDILAALAALDRRRAGIARGRAHNHDFALIAFQHVVEQPTEHLQRKILERQRRPLMQLHHPLIVIELYQWCDRGMAKIDIGIVDDRFQIGIRN